MKACFDIDTQLDFMIAGVTVRQIARPLTDSYRAPVPVRHRVRLQHGRRRTGYGTTAKASIAVRA
jgi:hypothetical protein